jgi:hypothetical protein
LIYLKVSNLNLYIIKQKYKILIIRLFQYFLIIIYLKKIKIYYEKSQIKINKKKLTSIEFIKMK